MEEMNFILYERVLKALANRRRLELFYYIADHDGLSVQQLANRLDFSYKSTAQHLARLANAGLIVKTSANNQVEQSISPFGQKVLRRLSGLI